MSKKEVELSDIAKAIKERPREVFELEVQNIFGLGHNAIKKVGFRVCSKEEEFNAVIAAHRWLKEKASDVPAVNTDDDIILDLKSIFVMFEACRRAEDGDKDAGYMYPAFPGPEWMRKTFTTDEIAELLNNYNAVKRQVKPDLYSFNFDKLDELIEETATDHESQVPEAVLSIVSREWLVQAFVVMARRIYDQSQSGVQGHNSGSDAASGEDTAEDASSGEEGG